MADYLAPFLKVVTSAQKHATEEEEEVFKPTLTGRIAGPLLDLVEKALVWAFVDKSQPNYVLSGNYTPVEESDPVPDISPVTGSLPECLNGEFLRVGPNPLFSPTGGYHWFDGDGMIHAVRIKNGKATYVSRYVKTQRLKQETYYGAPKFIKMGDMAGKAGLFFFLLSKLRMQLGVVDGTKGTGTGNTALAYHNGKLLALCESDKPYALRVFEDGDLETLGLTDYNSRLDHKFSAHPKLDPVTGELFGFGYDVEKAPYVSYRVISKEGVMTDPVHITIPDPVMMHDFAITENYAIFMDLPVVFRPKEMVKSGCPFVFDDTKKSKFGILPRYAKNEGQIRWFELPSCYIFHNLNAWEEGDEVVLYSCRLERLDLSLVSMYEADKLDEQNKQLNLYEFRFNLKNGAASQRRLGDFSVDFPKINEAYIGRKQRYGYTSQFDKTKITAVVKVDLFAEPQLEKGLTGANNVKGVFLYGEKRYGSEAVFVPSSNASEEDDGYLITFVHDEILERSEVIVIDAKTMSSDPVAVVVLPKRVPYGFHALFVSQDQLNSQKSEL